MQELIQGIKVIILDFDSVLVESAGIKNSENKLKGD